jgi:hypothetical protein
MTTENAGRYSRDYSKTELYLGNFVLVVWIILGALSFALFISWAALLFFGAAAFLVFYELGKHGCVTCYFCKTCTIGMGKLPDLFFRQKGTANVNKRALKIFPFTYLLLSALPTVLTAISLLQGATMFKNGLLAAILGFSAYTGIVRRQTLCNFL